MTNRRADGHNQLTDEDASGYVTDPMASLGQEFSEITEIHRSDRNLLLKAKRFGRWWALKCVAPGCGETAAAAALRKEFEVAAALPRDTTANVYALEHVDGIGRCIVMDYADGPTLREWLRGGPSRREREEMALRLVETVGRVHGSGVVHRDIKPENIIINKIGGRPLLIDFGLADTTRHSELKSPAGTRRYMSPEQLLADVPDIRNDIYSLGCVLEEMDLGHAWKSVARKCLRPAERRPADTEAMLRGLRRTRRTRRSAAVAGCLTVIMSATTVCVRHMPHTYVPDMTQRLRADSLARSIDSLREASDLRISDLTMSLRQVTDSVREANEAAEARKAEVRRAIEHEKAVIDKIWRETGMRYLDTAASSGFVANAYSTEPMDMELQRFMQSNSGHFSPEELLLAGDALNRHIRSNMELWIKRRQQMTSDF